MDSKGDGKREEDLQKRDLAGILLQVLIHFILLLKAVLVLPLRIRKVNP